MDEYVHQLNQLISNLMSMKYWWVDNGRDKPKYLEKALSQRHCESGTPQSDAFH